MTGRSSLAVRAARAVQRLPLGGLHYLERPLLPAVDHPARPIFLIALPRSGSTLAYQALVHGSDARYLTNLGNLLFFVPFLGGLASRRGCAPHVSDFRSRQGFVEGPCGPAEGLRFWSYWMGQGLSDADNREMALDPRLPGRVTYLQRALAALDARCTPFVSGYIGHSLVVEELARAFPAALFVRLTRDPVDNALSILRIQLEEGREAFSVMPDDLSLPPGAGVHDRVAAQVATLNRRVDASLDRARTITVAYEDLCADPAGEVSRVRAFCSEQGVPLGPGRALPPAFNRSVATGAWVEHRAALRDAFRRRAVMEETCSI